MVRQRDSARRHSRRPDEVDRIGPAFVCGANRIDTEEIAVHDCKKIARRKPVSGIDDLRSAPPHELFPGFDRKTTVVVLNAQPAEREQGSLSSLVLPVQTELAFRLMVAVDAKVKRLRKLKVLPGLVEALMLETDFPHKVCAVVNGFLGKNVGARLDESAMTEVLRQQHQEYEKRHQGSRRMA